MQILNRKIKNLFFISLALSVGFPAGILGIIFGAVNGIIPLLVIGIILTVAGFYLMPILWIRYAERRRDRTVLFMIENERIMTVAGISEQTGYPENDVREKIKSMINVHILTGYLFKDDTLASNKKENSETEKILFTLRCSSCGAMMKGDGNLFKCEYCGTIMTEKTD